MDPELPPTNEWTTAAPETYCIDYAMNHLQNAEYAAQITAAPPTILHVGVDTVINNQFGPTTYGGEGDGPRRDLWASRRLSPQELEVRARDIRAFVNAMHAAGVKTVMSYQSGSFFFGDRQKRTHIFDFYDHWDEYAEFGVGPRPETDPADWLGVKPRAQRGAPGVFVCDPCINSPGWQALSRLNAAWAARVGYDAIFSDVNAHHCWGSYCQAAFRRYLSAKYSPADLERLFGFKSPQDVRMAREGEGLLWVETQRHWGHSFAEFFAQLTAAGQAHQRGFFVLPNSGAYTGIDETYKRRDAGHYIQHWARVCPIFMYEKMEQPGRVGRTTVIDDFIQYKFAFANRTRAGVLLYNSQEAHSIALSNAEAAAMGGGSFIQGAYAHPEVRTRYRDFFESNRDLLAGYSAHSQVGMVFFYDEVFWEDTTHLEQVFVVKDYLCNNHVLWDFIVEKTFTAAHLAKYAAIVVPGLKHIGDEHMSLLHKYAKAGGGVVLIGGAGHFTEEGTQRKQLPFAVALKGAAQQGIHSGKVGRGWVIHAAKIENLIRRPAFEVFQLTEDEANDTATIIKMAAEAEAKRRPRGSDRLLALCEKMSKRKLSVATGEVPFTLRVAAYKRRDAEGRRLTVHLLNYDVPIHAHQQSGPPVPVIDVALSVPLPAGWKPTQVRLRGPQAVSGAALPFTIAQGRLVVTVPRVEIYELLEVAAE